LGETDDLGYPAKLALLEALLMVRLPGLRVGENPILILGICIVAAMVRKACAAFAKCPAVIKDSQLLSKLSTSVPSPAS
jgi:hypothetical protein